MQTTSLYSAQCYHLEMKQQCGVNAPYAGNSLPTYKQLYIKCINNDWKSTQTDNGM